MAWAKLDDKLHQNPKLATLPDRAFRLYIHALTFSASQGTSGQLLRQHLPLIWPTCSGQARHAAAKILVEKGCWIATEQGWEIHDYLEYNPPAERVAKKAATLSKSGGYGNHKRWHVGRGVSDPDCKWCRNGDRKRDRVGDRCPDRIGESLPSRPVPLPPRTPPGDGDSDPASSAPPDNGDGGGKAASPEEAKRPGELWGEHKRRPLRLEERNTIQACLERFGTEITTAAVEMAIGEGAEYASRIELHAGQLAGPRRAPARAPTRVVAIAPEHPCQGRHEGETWSDPEVPEVQHAIHNGWWWRKEGAAAAVKREKVL